MGPNPSHGNSVGGNNLAIIFIEPTNWWLLVLKTQIVSTRPSVQGLRGPHSYRKVLLRVGFLSAACGTRAPTGLCREGRAAEPAVRDLPGKDRLDCPCTTGQLPLAES